jgi:hypothetical protein
MSAALIINVGGARVMLALGVFRISMTHGEENE